MRASRFKSGFAWGVVATVAMSALMILGTATGVAPIPEPIPAALVRRVLGEGLAAPLVMLLAAGSHLLYGGVWGGAFAAAVRRVTVVGGLGLGVGLWLLMQVAVLPFLGWGAFGAAVTPAIAVATLVLHLVYGGTYGWLMDRRRSEER